MNFSVIEDSLLQASRWLKDFLADKLEFVFEGYLYHCAGANLSPFFDTQHCFFRK